MRILMMRMLLEGAKCPGGVQVLVRRCLLVPHAFTGAGLGQTASMKVCCLELHQRNRMNYCNGPIEWADRFQ